MKGETMLEVLLESTLCTHHVLEQPFTEKLQGATGPTRNSIEGKMIAALWPMRSDNCQYDRDN
jgi:hypothetical protein